MPLLNCNIHFWSQLTLGTFQFTVMNCISIQQICDFKNSRRLIDSLVISLFLDYFTVMIKSLCVLFFCLTRLVIDTVTLRDYISRIKAICSLYLAKNLFYYPSLWLITSLGAGLVFDSPLIPLFRGPELKLTNSHVFINTHNLRKLYSKKKNTKILIDLRENNRTFFDASEMYRRANAPQLIDRFH